MIEVQFNDVSTRNLRAESINIVEDSKSLILGAVIFVVAAVVVRVSWDFCVSYHQGYESIPDGSILVPGGLILTRR